MSNMSTICVGQEENEEALKRKRIKVYKTILNYYRGKSLSLEVVIASKQPNVTIAPDMKSYEAFVNNMKGLHNDITLLQSLKDCVTLIKNSLTYHELTYNGNFTISRSILNKVEGITYISKLIMESFSKRYSEFDLIEKKKNYTAVLAEYGKKLDMMRENQKVTNVNSEEAQQLEKAELLLYKINLIRAMKGILIGYISVSHPDLLPRVEQLRTPERRNLTLEDFRETWNVGLPS